jgi:peptidoglycan hydrolase-like protein with peptidoglycan-binding domain
MAVTAEKIIEIAKNEIGTKATNVKKCKYNTWYYGTEVSGSGYDWCAVFVCWLFNKAGAMSMLPTKTASCGTLASSFNTKGKFYKSGFKAGDIVFFHWSNTMSSAVSGAYTLDHVGIIEKVNSDGTYTTIEGNTGSTSNGEVMRRTRSAGVISGVARPDYTKSTSTTTSTSTTNSTTTSSSSSKIKTVQTWLNKNYSTKLTVDGIYGTQTKKAIVKALQTYLNKTYSAKLTVDGIMGAKTKAAIHNVKQGASGNYVYILQSALICNSYDINFDGKFGAKTLSAVKSFQTKKKLTVDGIAGQNTFYALLI